METQNERQGLIIGRNAVYEALKSGRAIDSLLVAKVLLNLLLAGIAEQLLNLISL